MGNVDTRRDFEAGTNPISLGHCTASAWTRRVAHAIFRGFFPIAFQAVALQFCPNRLPAVPTEFGGAFCACRGVLRGRRRGAPPLEQGSGVWSRQNGGLSGLVPGGATHTSRQRLRRNRLPSASTPTTSAPFNLLMIPATSGRSPGLRRSGSHRRRLGRWRAATRSCNSARRASRYAQPP